MNTAIIVAAGEGKRFGGDRAKQFVEILGKPLIIHTLERFEACPAVHEIVLVLSEIGKVQFEISNFRSQISKLGEIRTGGATRAESVRNGLKAINATNARIVAVHDGARPLVRVDEITRTVEAAEKTGAACLVAEIADTVKTVQDERITGTVDRRALRRALTPQAFRYDIFSRAFEGPEIGEHITDECYLVEKLGVEIAIVEGSANNLKITRAEDIILAEALLRSEKDQLSANS